MDAFVGFPVFLKSMSVQHHFYQNLIEGSNVFFFHFVSYLKLETVVGSWFDPVRMASDSGLVRRTAVRFQHFRRGTFWYTATSLCDSKSISWAHETNDLFEARGSVWRLKEGSKSPTFSPFFLGDFCWFFSQADDDVSVLNVAQTAKAPNRSS